MWGAPIARTSMTDAEHFKVGKNGVSMTAEPVSVADIAFAAPFQGNVRVEWTATVSLPGDMNCFICGADRDSGYIFHVGGFGELGMVCLNRGPVSIAEGRMPQPIRANVAYHFRMERFEHHLRLAIDGVQIIDAVDADPFETRDAAGFGFETGDGRTLTVRDVRVSCKPLPQIVPAIAIANHLFRLGQYGEARTQYAEITDTYTGTDMAAEANFRLGLCDLRSGSEIEGVAQLQRFERMFPRNELVPYSLYERALVALKRGDEHGADELFARVKTFATHPVIRRMFLDFAARYSAELRPRPLTRVGDSQYPPDAVARVERRLDELAELARMCGMPLHRHVGELIAVLRQFGAYDRIVARFDDDGVRASVLCDEGRFEEALRLYPHVEWARYSALIGEAKYDEALALNVNAYSRAAGLYMQGRVEQAPESVRKLWLWQLWAGHYDELIRDYPDAPTGVALALIRSGRAAQVLDRPKMSDWEINAALCALGRYEEVLDHPNDTEHPWQTALHRCREGRMDAARELIAQLAGQPGASQSFQRLLLPIVLDAFEKRPDVTGRLHGVAEQYPHAGQQGIAYLARYLTGEIGDREFSAQPLQTRIRYRLLFAQALRADIAGDHATAHARYADIQALKDWERGDSEYFLNDFVAWRSAATATP
jgi:hypothetical protein